MSPEDLESHSNMIEKSVAWIEKETNDIWTRYEEIDDCSTNECKEEKLELRSKMDRYINKLQDEEKMIDQYEEILHNKTGIK
tara:strand:+ start:1455 stop:1700 length:246 start_codon:yes stop_codon:yes gene_type:complete